MRPATVPAASHLASAAASPAAGATASPPASSVDRSASPDAVEFVRFCYRRRRVGWPELYDEMCAVAGRGLFRGWSHGELADHGIAFELSAMPRLAALVRATIESEPALPPVARRERPRVGVAED
ncbi:MAG: hypothetical protein RL338_1895 [Chloroflexota bacterium]